MKDTLGEWGMSCLYYGYGKVKCFTYDLDGCCRPFVCGDEKWFLQTFHILSGIYKVILYGLEQIGCQACGGCGDRNEFYFVLVDEATVRVDESSPEDVMSLQGPFFIWEGRPDAYAGPYLHLLNYYDLCTRIYTNKLSGVPSVLYAHLLPEGAMASLDTIVELVLAEDPMYVPAPECPVPSWGFDLNRYFYKSSNSIRPLDLWPFTLEEWDRSIRRLTAIIRPSENGLPPGDSIAIEYVFNLLHLQYLNDSTNCFIPADSQLAEFRLLWSNGVLLDTNSTVNFCIMNSDKDTVYAESTRIHGIIPEEPGNPLLPEIYSIDIIWDGRCNKGEYSGHLADPEKGIYSAGAMISIGEEHLKSNIDTFSVVPKIDSVIVTNWPSYPPMSCVGTLSCDAVATVIKAKIDDASSGNNYRYYAPGLQHARYVNIWNSAQNDSNFYFWDVGSPKKRYYEKENKPIQVRNWPVNKFGALNYVWKIIYDRRIGTSVNVRYTGNDIVNDTSNQWGHNWFASLHTYIKRFSWLDDSLGYMRNLIYSEVKNTKNEIILQADTSATGAKAHKLIFAPVTENTTWDIVDWALTHVGVPYASRDASVKIPYIKIDCSSLVTAAKIQTIGVQNNTLYRIGEMNSVSYRDTVYRGVQITRRVKDPLTDTIFNYNCCR